MLKKVIKYKNYNDEEREKTYYFNLKKSELLDLQFSTARGFIEYIKKITESEDTVALWKAFRDIVLLAYGEKSEDGERFVKSPEISKAFEETEAFSELIVELMSSEDAAAEFINSIMPKNLVEAKAENNADN